MTKEEIQQEFHDFRNQLTSIVMRQEMILLNISKINNSIEYIITQIAKNKEETSSS